MPAYLPAYLPTYLPAYLPAYLPPSLRGRASPPRPGEACPVQGRALRMQRDW